MSFSWEETGLLLGWVVGIALSFFRAVMLLCFSGVLVSLPKEEMLRQILPDLQYSSLLPVFVKLL